MVNGDITWVSYFLEWTCGGGRVSHSIVKGKSRVTIPCTDTEKEDRESEVDIILTSADYCISLILYYYF